MKSGYWVAQVNAVPNFVSMFIAWAQFAGHRSVAALADRPVTPHETLAEVPPRWRDEHGFGNSGGHKRH